MIFSGNFFLGILYPQKESTPPPALHTGAGNGRRLPSSAYQGGSDSPWGENENNKNQLAVSALSKTKSRRSRFSV